MEKENYLGFSDTLFLSKDTTVEVTLEILSHVLSHADPVVRIFPVPADGMLSIESTKIIGSVAINDLSGRNVFNTHAEADRITLDINEFDPGIYIVRILHQDGSTFVQEINIFR